MIFTVWYSGWAYSIWCVMCSQKLSNVPNSHFSVIDKRCQGLKIALCLSLAPLQSFITVWEYCTHTDNSSLVDSAVSASEPVRAAVILIALLRAVNHGLKRLNCVKIKLYFSLYWFPEYVLYSGSQMVLHWTSKAKPTQYKIYLGQWYLLWKLFIIKKNLLSTVGLGNVLFVFMFLENV